MLQIELENEIRKQKDNETIRSEQVKTEEIAKRKETQERSSRYFNMNEMSADISRERKREETEQNKDMHNSRERSM